MHLPFFAVLAALFLTVAPGDPSAAAGGVSAPGNDPGPAAITYQPIRQWKFTDGAEGGKEWSFLGSEQSLTPEGMVCQMPKKGPLMRINKLQRRALDISAVDIEAAVVYDGPDGTVTAKPKALLLFWARDADLDFGAKWPFNNERSVAFDPLTDHPGQYRADVSLHGNWIGAIAQVFIAVKPPDEIEAAGKPFRVIVKRVALLEEVWPSEDAPTPAG